MAKTASREKKDRSRHWQRAATRASIQEAARRLIARVGTDNLSLTAVAREADFAPTTVFAYYANKNDLFLSVLAADLANFARTMREYGGPEEQEISPEDEFVAPNEAGAATAPMAPETYPPSVSEEAPRLRLVETQQFDPDLDVAAGEAPDWASQEEIATLLRDELARDDNPAGSAECTAPATTAAVSGDILHELAELRAAVAKLETRPVDQWLERRLREFERGLTALEARPEKAEIAATLTDLNDNLRKLGTRVDIIERRQAQSTEDATRAMRERDEQVEKRLREFLSDVEAANARATTRLNALENAAFAVAPEYFQATPAPAKTTPPPETPAAVPTGAVAEPISSEAPKSAAPDALVADTPAVAIPDAPVADTPVADTPPVEPAPSYLSAARRSALAAARDGASDVRKTQRSRGLSKRTLYMIAAGLALVVGLVWTGVFVKALAVPAPQHPPERTSMVAKVQKLALKPDAQTVLLQAARAGNARAQLAVALNLLDGPRKNEALAARWMMAAAQRGDAVAAFKLATLYRSGRGVAADAGQAFRWFEAAARKGNTKAMQDLAVAYAEGWGTNKNPSEAARWFTHAASLGLTDAQFNLGVLYEEGLGVPQSLLDAYKWYLIAAGAGDHEAEMRVDAIKPQLSSSDVAAAEEAAASFKPASPDRDANVAPSAPQLSAG